MSILHSNYGNILGSGGKPIIFVNGSGIDQNTHCPHLNAPAKTLAAIQKFLA